VESWEREQNLFLARRLDWITDRMKNTTPQVPENHIKQIKKQISQNLEHNQLSLQLDT